MRVLVVNNFVRHGSGVDACVRLELRALAGIGHDVAVVGRDNRELDTASTLRKAALLASSLYSVAAYRDVDRALTLQHVDVVHLHNLVPFVTGAVYDACRKHGVPTVQHLHNYRAFCLSSYAHRADVPCDACAGSAFLAGAASRCYRHSYASSAGLVAARWVDWARGRRSGYQATAYIAVSQHTARRHVEHGLPQKRVRVLHDAADDLAALLPARQAGRTAARKLTFVGSLIAPKGPWRVLDLAAALPEFDVQFLGTGDGAAALAEAARRRGLRNVSFRGVLTGEDKATAWADSFLTVVPSLWDEPFGLAVPESYSLGVPVLATAAGGLAETVSPGRTGLRLDVERLDKAAEEVRELWRDEARYRAMRTAARAEYERRFCEATFAAGLDGVLREAAAMRPAATARVRRSAS